MKFLIVLIKWGLPLLVVTDLSSTILANPALLNFSRGLRILILLFFILENIRSIKIVRKFFFADFFFFFLLIHFFYLFTDPIFFEGVWQFSRMLFWILGVNVLFVYAQKNKLNLDDFEKVIKRIAILAFLFTGIYYATGLIESDYNVAAYLGVFIYPVILYTSNNFKKNRLYIFIVAITIMVTIKRGAILAFFATNFVFYFWSLLTHFQIKKFVLGLSLLSIMIFVGINIITIQESRVESRLSEEQIDINSPKFGSGRVVLYASLYNEWIESDNIIFGFGNQADSHRWGGGRRTTAHSDIFAYLYNYGIIGIILITLFYLKIVQFYKKCRKIDSDSSSIIVAIFVTIILINIYSGLFREVNFLYLLSVFPYLQFHLMSQQPFKIIIDET